MAILEPEPPVSWYANEFERFVSSLPEEPAALVDLRRQAMNSFSESGFPHQRQEDWRFTDVSPITRTAFEPAPTSDEREAAIAAGEAPDDPGTEEAVAAVAARAAIDGAFRMVYVNGIYAAELSSSADLPPGVRIRRLKDVWGDGSHGIPDSLARYARIGEHPFVDLNTAFLGDGAFVHLSAETVLERPLQLTYIGTGRSGPVAGFPRTLIRADRGSQGVVVETYAGADDEAYFTCGVTELAVGENASLEHYKLQEEGDEAYHIGAMALSLARDSRFSSHSISTGGRLVRSDVVASLDGEGVDCTLNGLYVATGKQFVDNHMLVRHNHPQCTSHEHYRGILDGSSHGVFNGRIYVHPGAQKTDALQSNRNLLLSREARVNSNPQLEIFADDVRCSHGSTVGQLDEDALFYLRSRGLRREAARSLLIYAFASEILQGVALAPVRQRFETYLAEHLPGGDVVSSLPEGGEES